MAEPVMPARKFASWSIRRHLFGTLAAVCVLLLLLSAEPVRQLETEAMTGILREQFSNALDSLVPVLKDHVITRDAEMDLPVLQRTVEDFLRTHQEVRSMRIEDAEGSILVSETSPMPTKGSSTFEVSRVLMAGDFAVGRVEIVVDLYDLEAQVGRHVLRLQGLFALLLLIVAVILIAWFYRLAVRPLRQIDAKLRNLLDGAEIESGELRAAEEFVRLNDSVDALASAVQLEEENKELEQQLQQSQKLEAIGRLAGGVAHDFNNLLTVILGYADTLVDDPSLGEAARGGAGQIVSAGERAAALTRQLLAFSRKQVLRSAIVSPADILRGMEEMLRRLIGELIEVRVRVREPVGLVHADTSQLEQVLMNLAVNARDAMGRGGVLEFDLYSVRAASDEELGKQLPSGAAMGDYVVLAVTDDGVGMDEETRKHVFEPFFTTKEAGDGTGLGLAMVYGIVVQSGGYIDLESRPGEGTTFRIFLPEVQPEAEALVTTSSAGPGDAVGTILLVEDEGLVRTLAQEILSSAGHEVLVACDSGEAFEVSDSHEGAIDLIVTDLVLPGMSGIDLSKEIRERRPGTLTLLVSGYDNGLLGPEERGIPFLQKPFDRSALLTAVSEVLAGEA